MLRIGGADIVDADRWFVGGESEFVGGKDRPIFLEIANRFVVGLRVEVAANERRLMLFLHFVRDERDGQIAIFSRQRPVTATEDELFKFDDEKTTFFLRPRKGNVFRFDGFLLRKNADSILAALVVDRRTERRRHIGQFSEFAKDVDAL